MVIELNYAATNTYLIKGKKGNLLFDTGWAGTFSPFCRAMGACGERIQEITYILISHYHPDHVGIAQEIADAAGAKLVIMDVQKMFVHVSDPIFEKEKHSTFVPIREELARIVPVAASRDFLKELGIAGEILHTPGHSDDSVSLLLDTGELFVGDLNPLYELELHRNTEIERSWRRLLERKPETVYYGHARAAVLNQEIQRGTCRAGKQTEGSRKITGEAERIVKLLRKGYSLEKIYDKTGFDKVLIEDVTRIYLTHPGVSLQGILDRIEIKGK